MNPHFILSPLREALGYLLVGVWLGYIGYRLEYYRQPVWLYIALILKVVAAWIFAGVYAHYYKGWGDTVAAYLAVRQITHYFLQNPLDGIALLFREFSPALYRRGAEIAAQDSIGLDYEVELTDPTNYFFYRLLFPIYLAAGGSYYGMQGIMGLIGGLLSYAAYQRWASLIQFPRRFYLFWFFLPSSLFWTSGALRDTLAFPLTLYGAAWIASVYQRREIWKLFLFLFLYFLRPESCFLAIGVGLWYRWSHWKGLFPLSIALSIPLLGFYLGPWAYAHRVEALQLITYPPHHSPSAFHLDYAPTFWGSWVGWLKALPLGLVGPPVWQSQKPFVFLYTLEGWALIGLSLVPGIGKEWNRQALILTGIGIFVIGVTTMAMPFWGNLARYKLYGIYFIALGLATLEERAQKDKHGTS
ncbi:MAG: hypothetical protein RMK19_03190 [Bacteroidia bacterium]|nr:hypothetical protein [Bacteroidia bacterium]MDW8014997.1 hypothetical protein [Bacteroidia bacterium]